MVGGGFPCLFVIGCLGPSENKAERGGVEEKDTHRERRGEDINWKGQNESKVKEIQMLCLRGIVRNPQKKELKSRFYRSTHLSRHEQSRISPCDGLVDV
jgi:hypothetical protein